MAVTAIPQYSKHTFADELTPTDFQVLVHDFVLRKSIQENCPALLPLMDRYPSETMGYLMEKGKVLLFQARRHTKIGHEGDDNLITWREYYEKILAFFAAVNNDPLYSQARETVAMKIWRTHYEYLPRWPAPGTHRSTSIPISCHGIATNEEFDVHWSVTGIVDVRDETKAMGTQRQYDTYFDGTPIFKSIKVDKKQLAELRCLIAKNKESTFEFIRTYVPTRRICPIVPF